MKIRILFIIFLLGISVAVNAALAQKESVVSAQFSKATSLLYEKQYDRALEIFEASLKVNADDVGAAHNRACAYVLMKQYDKAVEAFKAALALEKKDFRALMLFDLAVVYLNMNQKKEAFAAVSQAIELVPGLEKHDNIETLKEYCETDDEQGLNVLSYSVSSLEMPDTEFLGEKGKQNAGEGTVIFELGTAPALYFYKSPKALLCLGSAFFFEKKFIEAKESLGQALTLLQKSDVHSKTLRYSVNYYLGLIGAAERNHKTAVRYFEDAVTLQPESIDALRELAWAYFLTREYLKARDTCEQALELKPDERNKQRIKELFETINKNYIQ